MPEHIEKDNLESKKEETRSLLINLENRVTVLGNLISEEMIYPKVLLKAMRIKTKKIGPQEKMYKGSLEDLVKSSYPYIQRAVTSVKKSIAPLGYGLEDGDKNIGDSIKYWLGGDPTPKQIEIFVCVSNVLDTFRELKNKRCYDYNEVCDTELEFLTLFSKLHELENIDLYNDLCKFISTGHLDNKRKYGRIKVMVYGWREACL